MFYKPFSLSLMDLINGSQAVALSFRYGPSPATAFESRTNTWSPTQATSTQLASWKLQELLRQTKVSWGDDAPSRPPWVSSMRATVPQVAPPQRPIRVNRERVSAGTDCDRFPW